MSRRLDIGVASYRNPERLAQTLSDIEAMSRTDWRCFIIHNPSEGPEDDAAMGVTRQAVARNPRFLSSHQGRNTGYAGAVNRLFEKAETEYIAYLDNDVRILTEGWDEKLCSYLDRFHEIGMIFPNTGHCPIPRAQYSEVLWAAGFCWIVPRMAQAKVGLFDVTLGHHEEVDFCTRIKLEGYRLACAAEVRVSHEATATNSPESQQRISAGVVKWMDRWCAYFCGKDINYHSPNVLRILDWNVHALHMEQWFKLQPQLAGLNDNPETVTLHDGSEWDLIKKPMPKGFYRGRII